jgi:hypothetical protein
MDSTLSLRGITAVFEVGKTGHFDYRHRAGRRSYCEPLAEAIAAKVEVGLSARRIYQDLVKQNGFKDSYQRMVLRKAFQQGGRLVHRVA